MTSETDFSAASIAASIAGKAASPFNQRLDVVARRQRLPGDAADHAGKVLQVFRAVMFRLAEIFGNVAAESLVDRELDGAAADAVDAEREVEQGAQRRQRQMRPSQSVAARESRLWSSAWTDASTAATRSKPAARCGQKRARYCPASSCAGERRFTAAGKQCRPRVPIIRDHALHKPGLHFIRR